jgi:hypothetical protein
VTLPLLALEAARWADAAAARGALTVALEPREAELDWADAGDEVPCRRCWHLPCLCSTKRGQS